MSTNDIDTKSNHVMHYPVEKRTVLWVLDGSLRKQLHKNARLKPASELRKIGWDVFMITSGAPDNAKKYPIKFIEVGWPQIYFLGAALYYLKLIRLVLSDKFKADIIFFQIDSLAAVLLVIPLLQKIIRKNSFTVVMDYRSLPMDTKTVKGKLRSVMFYIGAKMAGHLDVKVTAITQQLSDTLKLKNDQLVGVWPSGADIEEFSSCYKKRRWPEDDDPIRLIYLGVLREERNLRSVAEAARIARSKGINLTLSFVGDGEQKNILRQLAEQIGDSFIKIDGPYPYQMVPDVLAQHHIGILPFPDVPKMKVSSAIKMFEYMAAGMPIMATRIIAHERVFNDENFVFWSTETAESMAAAIEAIHYSKNELPRLGKEAINYSRNWSWEKSAIKLSNALTRAIS